MRLFASLFKCTTTGCRARDCQGSKAVDCQGLYHIVPEALDLPSNELHTADSILGNMVGLQHMCNVQRASCGSTVSRLQYRTHLSCRAHLSQLYITPEQQVWFLDSGTADIQYPLILCKLFATLSGPVCIRHEQGCLAKGDALPFKLPHNCPSQAVFACIQSA